MGLDTGIFKKLWNDTKERNENMLENQFHCLLSLLVRQRMEIGWNCSKEQEYNWLILIVTCSAVYREEKRFIL